MKGNAPEGRLSSSPSSLAKIPKDAFFIHCLGLPSGKGRKRGRPPSTLPGSPAAREPASTAPEGQPKLPLLPWGVSLPDPATKQGALPPRTSPTPPDLLRCHTLPSPEPPQASPRRRGGERSGPLTLLTSALTAQTEHLRTCSSRGAGSGSWPAVQP